MPVTNLDFLRQFTKGDTAKMKKYIDMYLEMASQKLQVVNDSLASKDYESLKVAAHTLKSQSKYMGVSSAEEDIIRIERFSGEQVNLEELPGLVTKVSGIISQSIAELKEITTTL